MEKLRYLSKKYVYVFSILIILVSLLILSFSEGSGHIGIDLIVGNLKGRIPASIVLVVIMVFLGFARNNFRREGLLKGFLNGWALLLIGVLYFLLQLFSIDSSAFEGVNVVVVTAIMFDMLWTGIFEEVLMRGVVFQTMREAWGSNTLGVMKSALISSCLFGLIHLANYSDVLIIATVSQVFYTTFIGIFLCGVFVKSKNNLWAVILLHAVFDFLTLFLQQDFTYTTAPVSGAVEDISLGMGLITIVATAPLCILGIRYLLQATTRDTKSQFSVKG